jgi:hypothetical protein
MSAGNGSRWLAAVCIVAAVGVALPAQAQDIPIPRPSPAKVGPTSGGDSAPALAEPDPLLEGANSTFATGPIDESDDAVMEDESAAIEAVPSEDAPPANVSAALGALEDEADNPFGPGPATVDNQPDLGLPANLRPGAYTLEARLAAEMPALADGVTWRIFDSQPGADGKLALLGEATGGTIHIRLDPGSYFVHAAFGRAGATTSIEVKDPTGGKIVLLNAGGLKLTALVDQDQPLNASDVRFDIYAPDQGGSDLRRLIVPGAPPGSVIGLNAGTYHVICRYGDANAVVRADIRVDAGKLTEATVYQKAARLTLKLVDEHGGEAIADTSWSVVSAAGESVVQSVGAFPTVVLAVGEYTAIAKYDGRDFQTSFKVEAGVNRDVEVLAR